MEAIGTFTRFDGIRETEADGMPALRAKVPDGWRTLSVRRTRNGQKTAHSTSCA
ncbi:hypothetical protein [Microbacterium sp. ANT_H45B]|uniref:hypothetical protein n=1 Tax=Microbacterium sp. ANT_H45B TaxID=2597346 RepID=UPI00165E9DB6|nr:hypothetical protein [Microbacterium sp. ANT_H45B]